MRVENPPLNMTGKINNNTGLILYEVLDILGNLVNNNLTIYFKNAARAPLLCSMYIEHKECFSIEAGELLILWTTAAKTGLLIRWFGFPSVSSCSFHAVSAAVSKYIGHVSLV